MDHSNKRRLEFSPSCGTLCTASSSHKRPTVFANQDLPSGFGTSYDGSTSPLPQNSNNNPCTDLVLYESHEPNMSDEPSRPNSDLPSGFGTSYDGSISPLPENSNNNPCTDFILIESHEPNMSDEPSRQNSDSNRNPDERELTPREKVLQTLSIYEQVYDHLMREKEARRGGGLYRGTDRIDFKTRTWLQRHGMVVNSENRIGHVPGVEVNDKFKYRTELQVVGVHFKPMAGIDYMKIGDDILATCVVASHGYDYEDRFGADVVEYSGEGSDMINRRKHHEDQKLVKGNLALFNSMTHSRPVRMVRGEKSSDGKGKKYTYCGLYLVEACWTKVVEDKSIYKFRLRRMSGQDPLT